MGKAGSVLALSWSQKPVLPRQPLRAPDSLLMQSSGCFLPRCAQAKPRLCWQEHVAAELSHTFVPGGTAWLELGGTARTETGLALLENACSLCP